MINILTLMQVYSRIVHGKANRLCREPFGDKMSATLTLIATPDHTDNLCFVADTPNLLAIGHAKGVANIPLTENSMIVQFAGHRRDVAVLAMMVANSGSAN